MSENDWHYTDAEGRDVGPVAFQIVIDGYKTGAVKDTTFIWHPTKCSAWTLVKDSGDIKALIDPPPPPPPPPPSKPVPAPRQAPTIESRHGGRAAAPTPAARPAAPIPGARPAAAVPRAAAPIPGRTAAPIPVTNNHFQQQQQQQQEQPPAPLARKHSRKLSGGSSQLSGPALTAAMASASRRSAKPGGQPSLNSPRNDPSVRKLNRNMSRTGKEILFTAGLKSQGAGWMERKTADGVPYYHNVSTGALSWDKPNELKDAAEIEADSGSWVWFPDEEAGYLPAMLLQNRPDGRCVVQLEDGRQMTSRHGDQIHPLSKASLARTEDDLTLLDSLDEGLILYNLRERFEKQGQIYTWIGTILISINPYETYPIYGVENIYAYKQRGNRRMDPHVYIVADEALKPLLEYGENHSILISGESGAGKTWNTKQCLSYLTEVTQHSSNAKKGDKEVSVESKILAANPILEAFGNAKTVRNDNSSRFGRFTEVHFKSSGKIDGARIDNFLLEKSRVVVQGNGERNYHIFYQLLSSRNPAAYGLQSMQDYEYLNKTGCFTVDGVDDANEYEVLLQAFAELSFSNEEVSWIMEIISAILHLGNATFVSDGGEGSKLSGQAQTGMQWIARLLHIDQGALEFGLVHRSIEVRGTVTNIPLKPFAARDSRDALSKSLYGQLFDWLVERVNNSLVGATNPWAYIGLLDIFGFEIFDHNSFEQLCINFTNEKLQQLFNRDTFKLEEAMYKREGIHFDHIKYVDNQPILDLIEMRPLGLLLTLDDMNRMPKSTDEGFVAKADSNHGTNQFFISSTITRRGPQCFTIKHYAGDVVYNTNGFLEKNKDLLFKDLYDVMTASTSNMTARMFPPLDNQGRAKHSLGAQFRKQLDRLMSALNQTQTHYIRCVKPNELKAPRMFNSKLSLEQLRYAGVFEAVRIRKQGFPFRYTYERFTERYKCVLLRGTKWVPLLGNTPRDKTKEILEGTGQDFSEVRFGKTMALYRAEQHQLLELLRALALERVCAMIQSIARGYMARRFVQKVRFVQPKIEAAVRSRDVAQLDAALAEFNRVCGHFSSMVADTGVVQKAKRLRFALVEWEKIAQEMNNVVQMDIPNDDLAFEALKNVVWRAEDLLDEPGTEWHMQMYEYSKDYFERERFARLDPKLEEAMNLLERDVMTDIYSQCKELRYQDPRLGDIEKFVGLSEEALLKMQYKKAKSLGRVERAQQKEINIREMFLDRNAQMFVFEQFNNFRNPQEFSSHSLQFWKREELAKNMLRWQKNSIKTSLTQMDPNLSKQAVRIHKSILGWCGDKSNPSPNSMAQEIIKAALDNQGPVMKDEIYCQLVKQLTDNPGSHSEAQAWKLFGLCTKYFAPSTDLSNYLHIFIRNHAPQQLKGRLTQGLYDSEYTAGFQMPPTVDQIPSLIAQFS